MHQRLFSAPLNSDAKSPSSSSEIFWIVRIPGHSPYDHVRLQRYFPASDDRHEVVLVDVRKLLLCVDRDETLFSLNPVENWDVGMVDGLREFLNPENEYLPRMPYLNVTRQRKLGLADWLGLASEEKVVFRVGQHRTRYLAWAGAVLLPVEVRVREASLLRKLCGATNVESAFQ